MAGRPTLCGRSVVHCGQESYPKFPKCVVAFDTGARARHASTMRAARRLRAFALALLCVATLTRSDALEVSPPGKSRAARLRVVRQRERDAVTTPRDVASVSDGATHPRSLSFVLDAFGERFDIELERHDDLFDPDYVASVVQPDGTLVDSPSAGRGHAAGDHCHYRGRVANAEGWSTVAVSTCDGVKGHVMTDGHRISLVPLDAPPDEDPVRAPVAARIVGDEEDDEFGWSGNTFSFVRNIASIASQHPVYSRDAVERRQLNTAYEVGQYAKLELVVVNDMQRTNTYKAGARLGATYATRNTTKTVAELHGLNATAASAATIAAMEADTVGIVNLVAAMYLDLSTPRLEVILRRQITFSTTEPDEVYYGCPINQENGGGCVGTWSTWWKDYHKNNSIPNDAMHVLTGRSVSGYLGVAGVRVACSAHHSGSGLTSTTMNRDDVEYLQTQFDTASTFAHEVGHMLGFMHDGDEESGHREIGGMMCIRDEERGDDPHIMATASVIGLNGISDGCAYDPTTNTYDFSTCWSPCSKAWYDYYMSTHRFWCLNYDNVCETDATGYVVGCLAGGPPAPPSPPPFPPPAEWIEDPWNITIVVFSCLAGTAFLVLVGYLVYRYRKNKKAAKVGPNGSRPVSGNAKAAPASPRQTGRGKKRSFFGACLGSCKKTNTVATGNQRKKPKTTQGRKVAPSRLPV